MRTLRKEPGKPWEIVEVPNELEALQKAVGGHLERVTFASDICVLCDKEALCKGLPHNTDICGTVEFFGTVLIVGMANGEFVSLSEQQVEDLWEMGALRRGDLCAPTAGGPSGATAPCTRSATWETCAPGGGVGRAERLPLTCCNRSCVSKDEKAGHCS